MEIDLTIAIIAGAIAAALLVLLAGLLMGRLLARRRREKRLREQFGPEYDRTLGKTGDRTRAERALEERIERVESFELRSISDAEREQFVERWRHVQADFVDHPAETMLRADALFVELMRARGYLDAGAGPDGRAEDLSVSDADLAEDYRQLRAVAERGQTGDASTEELRKALRRFRQLYLGFMEETGPDAHSYSRKVPVKTA